MLLLARARDAELGDEVVHVGLRRRRRAAERLELHRRHLARLDRLGRRLPEDFVGDLPARRGRLLLAREKLGARRRARAGARAWRSRTGSARTAGAATGAPATTARRDAGGGVARSTACALRPTPRVTRFTSRASLREGPPSRRAVHRDERRLELLGERRQPAAALSLARRGEGGRLRAARLEQPRERRADRRLGVAGRAARASASRARRCPPRRRRRSSGRRRRRSGPRARRSPARGSPPAPAPAARACCTTTENTSSSVTDESSAPMLMPRVAPAGAPGTPASREVRLRLARSSACRRGRCSPRGPRSRAPRRAPRAGARASRRRRWR